MSTRWILGLVLASSLAACSERTQPPVAATTAAPASAAATTPSASTPRTTDVLVAYLRGAEVQAENDQQRSELRRALSDLLDKPATGLRATRYAGPGGEPGQRELAQVLRSHLLPASPQTLDVDSLIAQKDSPEVRSALREKLDQVERSLAAPKK